MRHGQSPRRRVRNRIARTRCSIGEVVRNARAGEEPDRDAVGGQFAGKDAAAVGGEAGAVRGLARVEERAARIEVDVRVTVAVCFRGRTSPREFSLLQSKAGKGNGHAQVKVPVQSADDEFDTVQPGVVWRAICNGEDRVVSY